ncbi:MAG: tRNA epoxyqueuosine(34) reductase QueG [Pseudomonadales bacterium]|nr:tRNA epoxyqueuosine(34) reductase QueG [Pseudomonadales bacterium]MDG2078645.1 tRNA epoxyqueuosine(34) reductase QueG [Pseudomonadales bacterium]
MSDQADSMSELAELIKHWGKELGFQQVGICRPSPERHAEYYQQWLDNGYHGEMDYMRSRAALRLDPLELHPKTRSVIAVRMDYLPPDVDTVKILDHPTRAYISRYALGRDYHKTLRKRLALLADKIRAHAGPASQRPFVDSAPVLERACAERAGLGWIGKNTMLINPKAGSWFFLGELFTELELPVDQPHTEKHCGSCKACLDICPTQAFAGPFELDARKCISYLTIELNGAIPEQFRKAIGNRVFGCDDCQLICPWNKFAKPTDEQDFKPRHGLDSAELADLFMWDEATFSRNTQGSPIKRIGYERWLRNLAIGLGNGQRCETATKALQARLHFSPLVHEHVQWALKQLSA